MEKGRKTLVGGGKKEIISTGSLYYPRESGGYGAHLAGQERRCGTSLHEIESIYSRKNHKDSWEERSQGKKAFGLSNTAH